MKKRIIAAALLTGLGIFVFGSLAQGAEFIVPAKDRESGNVALPSGETHRNLYIAGGSVTVDSTIQGDLYVAGGTVVVNGPVEQDVTVAGGTVILNGAIGGDLRAGGGTLQVNAAIGGDVLAGGGTVTIGSKSSIAGDLIVGSGELQLDAPVAGSLRAGGGNMYLNSRVGGQVWIHSEDKVVFGRTSQFNSQVRVKAKNDPEIQEGAQFASQPEITKIKGGRHWSKTAGAVFGGLWLRLVAGIVVTLLLVWIFPGVAQKFTSRAREKFGKNAAVGLLSIVLWPIAVIICLITVAGMFVGGTLAALGFAWILLSRITADLIFGSWLMEKLTKRHAGERLNWQTAVLGSGVLTLITAIPIVGWLVMAVITLAAGGGIVRTVWQNRNTGSDSGKVEAGEVA